MLTSVLHSAPGGLVFAYPVTTFRVFAHSAIMIASGMSWYGGTAGKRRRGRPPGGPARRPPTSAGHPVTDGQMLINRYFADPVHYVEAPTFTGDGRSDLCV